MDYVVKNQITRFEELGFDEESIRVAKEDLENGVGIDVVETYMSVKLHKENRLALADAFRKGMPLWLGKKIAAKERNFQREVLSHIDERIPFEVMSNIVDSCKTAKHVQIAFKDYQEELSHIMDVQTETNTEKKEAEPEEDKPIEQKKHIRTVFDQMSENDSSQKGDTLVTDVIVENQKVGRPYESSEDFFDKLMGLMQELIKTNQIAIDAVVKRLNRVLDEKEKDSVPPYTPRVIERIEADKKKEENKQTDEMLDRVEVSKDATVRPYKDRYRKEHSEDEILESVDKEETFNRMKEYSKEAFRQSLPGSGRALSTKLPTLEDAFNLRSPERGVSHTQPVDGYVRMILMPDGTLHPVEIEVEKKKEPKGVMGFLSRIFGKGSPQEALVNQLVKRKLSAEQLRMIHRAVREDLEPDVIRLLIDSDVSATEMDRMIDVLLADKNKKFGEYVGVV